MKNKRFRIIFFLFFLVAITGILRILGPKQEALKVTETQPQNLQKQVPINEKIILIFNQTVATDNWEIVFSPKFNFIVQIKDDKMEIIPSEMLTSQTFYSLEIKNSNYKNFNYRLSFETTHLTTPPPYTGLGDQNFFNELDKKAAGEYPLLKNVPFRGKNWKIDYFGPLKLEVILKKDTPQLRQEVWDWISSQKVDPKTHEIIWKVQQ